MIEIGGRPLLWHIMKLYAHYGMRDFVVCLGYRGYVIKEFFANYYRHLSDLKINLRNGSMTVLQSSAEDWNVELIDTGPDTLTGGRLKRIAHVIGDEAFCMTYGDGLADVDLSSLIEAHRRHGRLATVTAVQPPGRFGVLSIDEFQRVTSFEEKPNNEVGLINGGFFVLEPKVFDYIEGDHTSWEQQPLRRLSADGQLHAFRHDGFWQPCDTLRDKRALEALWDNGNAPWCAWNRR
jgi:glucose-1-phosphate cytidylyltransferase